VLVTGLGALIPVGRLPKSDFRSFHEDVKMRTLSESPRAIVVNAGVELYFLYPAADGAVAHFLLQFLSRFLSPVAG